MSAAGEKVAMPATNLASYLRDSVKLSFKPGAFHTDQMYDAAQMLERYDALLTQRDALEAREKALREALATARKVLVVACGEKAPFVRIVLDEIDAALSPGEPQS